MAQKEYTQLDNSIQQRILKKLQSLKTHPSLHNILEPLSNLQPTTHRLRIGEYRLLLALEKDDRFIVLRLGHRREVYQVI